MSSSGNECARIAEGGAQAVTITASIIMDLLSDAADLPARFYLLRFCILINVLLVLYWYFWSPTSFDALQLLQGVKACRRPKVPVQCDCRLQLITALPACCVLEHTVS